MEPARPSIPLVAMLALVIVTAPASALPVVDTDDDGVLDVEDNCPETANPGQEDLDGDGTGDACDDDRDGDGVANANDAFPDDPAESADADGDGVGDNGDNCPTATNVDQLDADADGEGDACDADDDGDGVPDSADNCPLLPNSGQEDLDADGLGDACDDDRDGDGVPNADDAHPDDGSAAVHGSGQIEGEQSGTTAKFALNLRRHADGTLTGSFHLSDPAQRGIRIQRLQSVDMLTTTPDGDGWRATMWGDAVDDRGFTGSLRLLIIDGGAGAPDEIHVLFDSWWTDYREGGALLSGQIDVDVAA